MNADDPEACIRVAQLAYDYRQQFKRDVVIDLDRLSPPGAQRSRRPQLHAAGDVPEDQEHADGRDAIFRATDPRKSSLTRTRWTACATRAQTRLNEIYDEAKKNREQFVIEEFAEVPAEEVNQPIPSTAADFTTLMTVVESCTTLPEEFHLHPKLKSLLDRRRETLNGAPIDWGFAETLAFGSLVLEGTPVRLSGEDVTRGTFTQRHLEFYDYETGEGYLPLKHLPKRRNSKSVDSLLSEFAVMGFEFGYSVADPLTLVLWEAQFGDFVNGAQIIIDQFLVSAEAKWNQPSGLGSPAAARI